MLKFQAPYFLFPKRMTMKPIVACSAALLLLLMLLLVLPPGATPAEDYYQLLGVSRTASAADIKRAFKRLVRTKHPDRNKADPNANALFMRINRAYEILKSPELRQQYDRYGEEGIKAHEEEGQHYERHRSAEKSGGFFADDPQIVKLTPERYESIVRDAAASGQIWFVNFYASHVARSQKFVETWREVGHELEDVIRVAAVDCQETGYLCEHIPQLRSSEPPVFIFYPGQQSYTGPLTKEAMVDAALRRFESGHAELTESNYAAKLRSADGGGGPPHWLVTFCGGSTDCFSDRTLKKLSAVFHDYVGIGRVDCRRWPDLCRRLNPADGETGAAAAAAPAAAVATRLFVNASSSTSSWQSEAAATTKTAAAAAGLPVSSLHTQEAAREVLRLLPPLPALTEEAAERIARAVFAPVTSSGAKTHQSPRTAAHLLLLHAPGQQTDAQLKRLEPLLKPHRVRVRRLVCGDGGGGDGAQLCQRLGSLPPAKLPAAVLVKRSGAFEIYYGQLHYQDLKEFAITAMASPMTALTEQTFSALVDNEEAADATDGNKGGSVWFVDFFAPWCPPCMKALPEFREAARLYRAELAASMPPGVKLQFGTVDCTVEKALCERQGINSYPSLWLLLGPSSSSGRRRRVKFRGSKFAHHMLAFVEAFVKPAAIYLSPSEFKRTVATPDRRHVWLVYFHSMQCQPCVEFMPELNSLAKNFRNHQHIRVGAVDCVTHRQLCSAQGVRSYPTIRAFPVDKTGPEDFFDYNSPFREADSVSAWLESFAPQPILRFTRRSFQSETASAQPWVVYFYADWCGPCREFAPTFKLAAEKLNRYANFGKVDCDEYQDLCMNNGIQSMPSVALFRNGKILERLGGGSVHTLEAVVASRFTDKLAKARIYYGYHSNRRGGAGGFFEMHGGDDDGDGWHRVVVDDGSGGGGGFFNMGEGTTFQFPHDEF